MEKKQRSFRNPPSTGYTRPDKPGFYIWQDRHIDYGAAFARSRSREQHPWRWLCTFCDPPVAGFRCKKGAFQSIIGVAMKRHFLVRAEHHRYVASGRREVRLSEVYQRMSRTPGGGLLVYLGRPGGIQQWRDATQEETEYYQYRTATWDGYEEPGPPRTGKSD